MATVLSINTRSKNLGPRLPAVDRALSLLELLAHSQTGLTLSEVSRKLRIPKSTAHYLIHTLETRGYVQYGCHGRHISPGLRLSDLADPSRATSHLALVITPFLSEAAQRLKLTATGTVLLGAEAVIIGKYGCPGDPIGGAWVGRHIDLHCTAQGKALIAHLTESRLMELFRGREPGRFTSKTISSFAALRTHLAVVRDQGFAVNDEEHALGIRAVAAPVLDRSGSVVLAISVRGSTREIAAYRIEQLGFEMIRMASEISRELGAAQWERPFASRGQQ